MALVKMSADSLVDLLDELGIDKAETRTGELVRLLRKVKAAPQDQNIDPAFLAKLFYDDPGIFIASLVDSGFFNRHELNKFVKWAIGTQESAMKGKSEEEVEEEAAPRSKAEQDLEQQIDELQHEVAELNSDRATLRSKLVALNKEKVKLENEVTYHTSVKDDISEKFEHLSDEVGNLSKSNEALIGVANRWRTKTDELTKLLQAQKALPSKYEQSGKWLFFFQVFVSLASLVCAISAFAHQQPYFASLFSGMFIAGAMSSVAATYY